MVSFSPYKSEGLITEISNNVALTCLLSLCDCSLVIWCHSVLYFARHPQPLKEIKDRSWVDDISRNRGQNGTKLPKND